jgi:hypothetical protein
MKLLLKPRHYKLVRRVRYSVICRPYRESESRASRIARWTSEIVDGLTFCN